jgi:hypothetical protein
MILGGGVLHSIRMCSMDSMHPQDRHVCLSWYPGIWSQYEPIFCVLCIVLYRNWLILGWITVLCRPSQMVGSVSLDPVKLRIASMVSCMFPFVDSQILMVLRSLIPLYAVA